MKSLIFNVLICLLMISCSQTKRKGVEIPMVKVDVSSVSSSVNLSDIAGYTWTLLPTSDTLLINEINRVHNSDEYIYLSDVSSVYKFSYHGELIAKIEKQGNGPDEYLNVSDFQVCDDETVWILCRNTKSLLLYSWDNKLKKKIKLDLWVQNICLLNDKMLLYVGNEENDYGRQLFEMNINTGIIENSYKGFDPYKSRYLHVKGINTFCRDFETGCYYSELFNDTIYKISDDTIRAEMRFDWGGHNVPDRFYKNNFQDIVDFFQTFHSENVYAYGVNLFLKANLSTWVSYYYQKKCYIAVLSDNPMDQIVFEQFNVEGYPIKLLDREMFLQDNGTIVIPLDAVEVRECSSLSSEFFSSKLLQGIPEDSNPLLLIIQPK